MRVFVAALGFHEDVLLRFLSRFAARRDDVLLVVTCSPVAGSVKRAWDGLVASCSRQGFPEPRLLELECSDFYGSLARLRAEISRLEGEYYLLLGSGLRILSHILDIAFFATRKEFSLHYEPEGESLTPIYIPSAFYSNIWSKLSDPEKKAVKKVVEKPGISVRELADEIGVKEKTARNLLTRLKKKGLVEKKGRKEGVYPTPIAKALYS